VIVISGLSEAEDDYRGLEVVFRTKPLAPEELIALIRASLSASGNRATA
jgi:DNA-binding response OmpR family regulator